MWILQLSFLNPLRLINWKIVDNLKRDFRKEGCLIHKHDYLILIVINKDEFRIGLNKLGVSLKSFKANLLNSPLRFKLLINAKLLCLYSQHRACTAAKYLPPKNR